MKSSLKTQLGVKNVVIESFIRKEPKEVILYFYALVIQFEAR